MNDPPRNRLPNPAHIGTYGRLCRRWWRRSALADQAHPLEGIWPAGALESSVANPARPECVGSGRAAGVDTSPTRRGPQGAPTHRHRHPPPAPETTGTSTSPKRHICAPYEPCMLPDMRGWHVSELSVVATIATSFEISSVRLVTRRPPTASDRSWT